MGGRRGRGRKPNYVGGKTKDRDKKPNFVVCGAQIVSRKVIVAQSLIQGWLETHILDTWLPERQP